MFSLTIAKPGRAASLDTEGHLLYAEMGIAAAAVVVTVALLVRHNSAHLKRTGCIHGTAGGLELVDERNNQSYVLAGNLAGVSVGSRVTLEGRRKKGASTLSVGKVDETYGRCQP
jgi:hypothetical protein